MKASRQLGKITSNYQRFFELQYIYTHCKVCQKETVSGKIACKSCYPRVKLWDKFLRDCKTCPICSKPWKNQVRCTSCMISKDQGYLFIGYSKDNVDFELTIRPSINDKKGSWITGGNVCDIFPGNKQETIREIRDIYKQFIDYVES